MLEAIADIQGFVHGVDQTGFLMDTMKRQAVSFGLLRIGEGANQLSQATKALAPHVPWTDMTALRHRIAHGYSSVDVHVIWLIASTRLDALKTTLLQMLDELGPEEP
jgi:uncharacterized protein with HEPN domain